MRVHFTQISVEYGYDVVYIGDTDLYSGYYYDAYTGFSSNIWSGWIPLLDDNTLCVNLYTDSSITGWGFEIDQYEVETYNGSHFLCSYDSIPSSPQNYYLDSLLNSKLDNLNCSEKYVVIDSCNSGGIIPEVQNIGRYIMTACEEDEFSLEDDSLRHGIFTNYFLLSKDNAIDSNEDDVISVEEMFSYTSTNTISYSSGLGYTSHPNASDGISGENVLYPSLGSITLNNLTNSLNYSFSLHGNGQIQNLSVVTCFVNTTHTIYEIEDIIPNAMSDTGFELYSGISQLNGVNYLTGYGIFAEIQGNNLIILSSSNSSDYDLDSIDDVTEIYYGMNLRSIDSDSDGLNDLVEFYGETSPILSDTDGDGLSDGKELNVYKTDPTKSDTDGDGFSDGLEIMFGSDPLDSRSSIVTIILNYLGIVFFGIVGISSIISYMSYKKHKKEKENKYNFNVKPNITNFNILKTEKIEKSAEQFYQQPYSYTRISKFIICKNCGEPNEKDYLFCVKCGDKFPTDSIQTGQLLHEISERKFCTSCGETNNQENKYCVGCGKQFLLDNVQNIKSPESSQNLTSGFKICNNCGTLNNKENKFCIKCRGFL